MRSITIQIPENWVNEKLRQVETVGEIAFLIHFFQENNYLINFL